MKRDIEGYSQNNAYWVLSSYTQLPHPPVNELQAKEFSKENLKKI